MARTLKALTIAALLVPSSIYACLWVDGTTIDGRIHEVPGFHAAHMLRHAMSVNPGDLTALSKFAVGSSGNQGKEAEAVDKIYQGDLQAALSLLQKLEEENPRYSTASNLGTAYELIGDNVNALKWITDGIKRNADSHFGTEWLHVLILEAKVDAANHPDQPLKAHLLDAPERMQKDTQILVHGKGYSAGMIKEALRHQLEERMIFVKPKDPYVADLLYSFAIIEANLGTVEGALGLLELAKEYGFPEESLLSQHEKEYRNIILMGKLRWWGIVAVGVMAFGIFLKYAFQRKCIFLSRRAYLAQQKAVSMDDMQGK